MTVLIPIKAGEHKTRLSAYLSAEKRKELVMVMLGGVLSAVRIAGLKKAVYAVSADVQMTRAASRLGARAVELSSDSGVNSAVREAMSTLSPSSRWLVIPPDLPFLKSSDLRKAVELGRYASVVLSPSIHFDGTNLLLFSKDEPIELSYDRDSFANHLRSAGSRRLRVAVYCSPSVMRDLDTDDDLRYVMRVGRNRTARFLMSTLRRGARRP